MEEESYEVVFVRKSNQKRPAKSIAFSLPCLRKWPHRPSHLHQLEPILPFLSEVLAFPLENTHTHTHVHVRNPLWVDKGSAREDGPLGSGVGGFQSTGSEATVPVCPGHIQVPIVAIWVPEPCWGPSERRGQQGTSRLCLRFSDEKTKAQRG